MSVHAALPRSIAGVTCITSRRSASTLRSDVPKGLRLPRGQRGEAREESRTIPSLRSSAVNLCPHDLLLWQLKPSTARGLYIVRLSGVSHRHLINSRCPAQPQGARLPDLYPPMDLGCPQSSACLRGATPSKQHRPEYGRIEVCVNQAPEVVGPGRPSAAGADAAVRGFNPVPFAVQLHHHLREPPALWISATG